MPHQLYPLINFAGLCRPETYPIHPEKDIPEDEETAQEVIELGMSDHEVDIIVLGISPFVILCH